MTSWLKVVWGTLFKTLFSTVLFLYAGNFNDILLMGVSTDFNWTKSYKQRFLWRTKYKNEENKSAFQPQLFHYQLRIELDDRSTVGNVIIFIFCNSKLRTKYYLGVFHSGVKFGFSKLTRACHRQNCKDSWLCSFNRLALILFVLLE